MRKMKFRKMSSRFGLVGELLSGPTANTRRAVRTLTVRFNPSIAIPASRSLTLILRI